MFPMGRTTERAVGKDPAGMKTDRQPERTRFQARVRQDPCNNKKRSESSSQQHWIAELPKSTRD